VRTCDLYALTLILLAVGGCAPQQQVTRIDLTQRQGVYVVAHVEHEIIRAGMERRLREDLAAWGMRAYASVDDFDDVTSTTAERVFTAADRRRAVAVLVPDLVNRDGTGGIVDDPRRISPAHPDLRALYEYSRSQGRAYDPNREAIVEANLFNLEGGELFWSGTAWSFEADGSGAAIRELSSQIAAALAEARAHLLGSGSGSG
jgi:hypothetical protein